MTAPDPTAGERACAACDGSCGTCPYVSASPSAVAASTGTSEDVEALARVIERAENPLDDGSPVSTYKELAAAVLSSDWLAAQKAAARAEERERIAQAIEEAGRRKPRDPQWMWATDAAVAARIAREVRP